MIRYYWRTNTNKPVISTKTIRRIDGGFWFSEEDTERNVYRVVKRECVSDGVIEILKNLPNDFIQLPCWDESPQSWSLHFLNPNYSIWSSGDQLVLQILQIPHIQESKQISSYLLKLQEDLQEFLPSEHMSHMIHTLEKSMNILTSSDNPFQDPVGYQRCQVQNSSQLNEHQKFEKKKIQNFYHPSNDQEPLKVHQAQGTSSGAQKALKMQRPYQSQNHQEKESPRKLSSQPSKQKQHRQPNHYMMKQKCLINLE
jgi:hypothetical protein